MRCAILPLLVSLAFAASAAAQTPPSEAQIRADLVEHVFPTATSVEIRGDGQRELNRGVYQYVRSVTVRRPHGEVDGVEIEAYGDVVYDSHGSRYAYTDYRVGDWRYFGIPAPTAADVLAVLNADPAEAYPHGTLDLPRELTLAEGEEPRWHNLESVTVPVVATYYADRGGDAPVVHEQAEMEVRLYRESYEAPWTSFLATTRSTTELSRGPRPDGARTLDEAADIAAAEAHAAGLPNVEAPRFSSDAELGAWIYEQFRSTTDRARLEATIRSVLPSSMFVEGSDGALPLAAQMWLDEQLDALTELDATFAELSCPTATYDAEKYRRDGRRMHYRGILSARDEGDAVLLVKGEQEADGYRNGQPVLGRWVATVLDVWTATDEDDLAWLRSFDDPSALCSAAGQAVQSATQEAGAVTDGAADQARGAVEGAVQEGRRRLGRIFGRGGN
jgi:hypothetical protein